MLKLLKWLDDNLLTVLAGFLLIFIPLYPKLPLLDVLPGYIVRIRLEDIAVLITAVIWLIRIIRGKESVRGNILLIPIIAYIAVGILSSFSAVFIVQTVPAESIHVLKLTLHFLRRLEYFSLFFIFYSSVKSLKQIKTFLILIVLTVLAVAIYGFGQKYLYWPAFSTMNREFAKGWMLYLTEHARVLSTFGGHYDLAAFTMMVLILLWSLFFGLKKLYLRLIILMTIAFAFWTLILTASRTSFIAYILGIFFIFFLWAYKKGINWSIKRCSIIVFLSIIIMLSFGDLSERFTKFFRFNERLSGIKSVLLAPISKRPQDRAFFLENNPDATLADITSKSDQPPTLSRPIDVYQDIPLILPGSGSEAGVRIKRVYSKTAFTYDLSTAIRFDALWPQAVKGFKRNPLLGSGYSTLNKQMVTDFTEAESTDNDYLRSLGETGLLGFLTFFGTLAYIIYFIWRYSFIIKDSLLSSVAIGLGGLLVGLLVNAVYIDVFESSKVAFSFWAFTGITLSSMQLSLKNKKPKSTYPQIPGLKQALSKMLFRAYKFIKSDTFYILILVTVAFVLRLYKISTPLADWHSWRQADTSSVTRNYVRHGINILYPSYDDLSNVASGYDNPKGYRFVEFPIFNILSVMVDKLFVGFTLEISGRLTSIFASLLTIILLFKLVKKYLGLPVAFLTGLYYAIIPYNIFFTRTILPEPFLAFSVTAMIYYWEKWLTCQDTWHSWGILNKVTVLILTIVFTIISFLLKPFAYFAIIPVIYLWLKNYGRSIKSLIILIFILAICSLPLIWWRLWVTQFPEGVPAYMWLLNGDGIRFKGAFFYWIFAERLSKLILGYFGLPLLLLGIMVKKKSESMLFYAWGMGILLYVFVFATGNVRHDYYQIVTIPIIAIFMAKGTITFLDIFKKYSKLASPAVLLIIIIFMEMFGWYQIRDFYNINHPEIVEAGRAVERKTKTASLVIAPYNGDTAFLYQTGRAGWPTLQDSIANLIKKGAHYYVSVNFDNLTNELIKNATHPDQNLRKYKLIEITDKYVIIQLVPDNLLPK